MKKIYKKLAFGAAALALVGGIAPTLINNTYAEGTLIKPPLLRDTLYTTVGPDYFTMIDLDGITDQGYEIDVDIEDTSVATRYYGVESGHSPKKKVKTSSDTRAAKGKKFADPDYCDDEYVLCLQGKKIGETEITIYVDGSAYDYNLVSVKLTPEAYNVGAFGDSFTGTATIEGADEELLTLDYSDYWGNASVSNSGSRGTNYRVRSEKYSSYNDSSYGEVELTWKIGDQYVGGGTDFEFIPLVVVNNIDDLEETDELIKAESLAFFKSLWTNPEFYDSYYINATDFETETGALANVHFDYDDVDGPTDRYEFTADVKDAELSTAAKNKFVEKLPGKVSDVKYKQVSVTGELYYYYGGFPSNLAEYSSNDRVAGPSYGSNTRSIEMGEFTKFGTPLNITLDVSDAPELKSGYTRKYYVAMENGNKVELVDGEYNEKTKTFTFATQYFGNFAYGFVDELVPKVPDTGSPLEKVAKTAAVSFLPLIALTGVAFGIRNRKKASHKLAKKIDR